MSELVSKEYLSKQFTGYSVVLKEQLNKKIDIQQDVADANKLLGIGVDGVVTPVEAPDGATISADANNIISRHTDGLFAEETIIEVQVDGVALPITDKKVNITLTDYENVQSDWDETDTTNDSYIANKPDLTEFITKSVNDLENYYLKTETYSAEEVDNLLSALTTLKINIVATLPTTDISTTVIYLVPKTDTEEQDVYLEYINLDGTETGWECIGSTKVDLTNFYTKEETDELIKDELYTEVTTPAHYELSSIGVDGALEIVADGTATDGQIDISNVTDITVNIGDYVIFVDESTTYTEKYVSKVEGKGLSTNDLTDEIVEKIENTYSKDETYSRTEIDEKITESQTGMDVYSTDDWDSFYSALSIDATTI